MGEWKGERSIIGSVVGGRGSGIMRICDVSIGGFVSRIGLLVSFVLC